MGVQLIQRFFVWDGCWIGVYKLSCAEKVCYDHAYPKNLWVILNISNITDFWVLCWENSKSEMLTSLFGGAVSPIINLSLQSKLLEWNNNYKNQFKKKPCKWHGLRQRRYGWTDFKEFKMDCDFNYDLKKKWIVIVIMIFENFVSLTVFQSSFLNVWCNAWETYLFDLKQQLAIWKSFLC